MSPGKWQQIKEIFNRAMDVPTAERVEFVREVSAQDLTMFDELEKMLAFADDGDDSFDESALGFLNDDAEPPVPEMIGNYRIIREIGRGGMGVVYEARRETADFTQRVALKVIKRGMDTDIILSRFRNERQILASLQHPNIARFLDGGM